MKIILDLCGGTGAWSKPYKDYRDIYGNPAYHVHLITLPKHDVRIYAPPCVGAPADVYGILAAPPCTEFSFAKHFHGKGKYHHDFLKGLEIVSACMRIILTANPIFWALENPNGYLKKWLGKPMYEFEPWYFGDNYQKNTALWGDFNIPKQSIACKPNNLIKFSMLKSKEIHPELYGKLSRTERRAITPAGFAQAFFESNR